MKVGLDENTFVHFEKDQQDALDQIEAFRRLSKPETTLLTEIKNENEEVNGFSVKRVKEIISRGQEAEKMTQNLKSTSLEEILGVIMCAKCTTKKGNFHCARCVQQYYCSRDCQRADWSEHKKKCVPKSQ